mmetsp:Transcript_15011/g.40256  ORF Transcript_15011/g.40256 Transcript_15011/m.40256 type:complete len:284 (-) Transcript_15011:1806-2657(-)
MNQKKIEARRPPPFHLPRESLARFSHKGGIIEVEKHVREVTEIQPCGHQQTLTLQLFGKTSNLGGRCVCQRHRWFTTPTINLEGGTRRGRNGQGIVRRRWTTGPTGAERHTGPSGAELRRHRRTSEAVSLGALSMCTHVRKRANLKLRWSLKCQLQIIVAQMSNQLVAQTLRPRVVRTHKQAHRPPKVNALRGKFCRDEDFGWVDQHLEPWHAVQHGLCNHLERQQLSVRQSMPSNDAADRVGKQGAALRCTIGAKRVQGCTPLFVVDLVHQKELCLGGERTI